MFGHNKGTQIGTGRFAGQLTEEELRITYDRMVNELQADAAAGDALAAHALEGKFRTFDPANIRKMVTVMETLSAMQGVIPFARRSSPR